MQKIKLNGKHFQAMLDSGSKMSFIHSRIAKQLKVQPDGSSVNVIRADSKKLNCQGKVVVNLHITIGQTSKMVDCEFVVMTDLCVDVLMGNELMALLKLSVNPSKRSASFVREGKGLRLLQTIRLPPRSQTVVTVETGHGVESDDIVLATIHNIGSSILVANSIDQVDDEGRVNCLVINLEKAELEVASGTQIAGVQILEQDERGELEEKATLAGAAMQLPTTEEVVQIGDELSETQVNELRRLLARHVSAFSVNGRIGETNLIEHSIELMEGAQPVVEPLRRRPLKHRQECERQVAKMLQDGIIEHSSSPWAAAYVVVKKKTGDARICIDFRRLNA